MNKQISQNTTREAILDLAEKGFRKGGFSGLSHREIANILGIKSASVHYHFATKADLGSAAIKRYTDSFMQSLIDGDREDESGNDRLKRLSDAYIAAYQEADTGCLCAVLGSVSNDLPAGMRKQISGFYDRLIQWTDAALSKNGAAGPFSSSHIISALQGAMIMTVATENIGHLSDVSRSIIR